MSATVMAISPHSTTPVFSTRSTSSRTVLSVSAAMAGSSSMLGFLHPFVAIRLAILAGGVAAVLQAVQQRRLPHVEVVVADLPNVHHLVQLGQIGKDRLLLGVQIVLGRFVDLAADGRQALDRRQQQRRPRKTFAFQPPASLRSMSTKLYGGHGPL